MADLNLDGMALSGGVVETIIAIAAKEVDGVVSVGPSGGFFAGLRGRQGNSGIDVITLEDGSLAIEVHIEALYGSVLPDVADAVRNAVADAVMLQLGAQVASVDVFIDSVRF